MHEQTPQIEFSKTISKQRQPFAYVGKPHLFFFLTGVHDCASTTNR